MEQVYPTGGDGGWRAVPGLEEDSQRETDRLVTTLDVDGQRFAVRPDGHGGSHYTWLNGPDPGYGFSLSPTPEPSLEEHRGNIRDFMAQVDPHTGHIEDD